MICLHHTLSCRCSCRKPASQRTGGCSQPRPLLLQARGGGGGGPLRASFRMALPRTRWVTVCVPPACFCSVPVSALVRRPPRQFGLELGSLQWLRGSAPCPRLCPGGAHGRGQQPQSRRSARFPAALTRAPAPHRTFLFPSTGPAAWLSDNSRRPRRPRARGLARLLQSPAPPAAHPALSRRPQPPSRARLYLLGKRSIGCPVSMPLEDTPTCTKLWTPKGGSQLKRTWVSSLGPVRLTGVSSLLRAGLKGPFVGGGERVVS